MKSIGLLLIAVPALAGCAGLMLYRSFAVVPDFDGSGGSGTGFGRMPLHRGAPALAFSLSVAIPLMYGFIHSAVPLKTKRNP